MTKIQAYDEARLNQSFAGLHRQLGGVPLERICINPPPGTATEDDVVRYLESADRRLFELVHGTLVEKPMGSSEDMMAAFLQYQIQSFADESDSGIVYGGVGAVRMMFGNVRMPDVSYFPWSILPGEEFPDDPVCPIAPALAAEVLSPSNTDAEITMKRIELFKSGTKLMWVIDPKSQTAEIFTKVNRSSVIDAKGFLEGGRVLPGFRIQLADVFNSLNRKTRKRKGR